MKFLLKAAIFIQKDSIRDEYIKPNGIEGDHFYIKEYGTDSFISNIITKKQSVMYFSLLKGLFNDRPKEDILLLILDRYISRITKNY